LVRVDNVAQNQEDCTRICGAPAGRGTVSLSGQAEMPSQGPVPGRSRSCRQPSTRQANSLSCFSSWPLVGRLADLRQQLGHRNSHAGRRQIDHP
jgi:hypothetical protein